MLRWFPRLQVATACFLCSPPNLNFLAPYFIFMYAHYNHCHRATAHLQLNVLLLLSSSSSSSSPLWRVFILIFLRNFVPREYGVAAILLFLFMVLISLVSVLNLLYFYISTFWSMCAVPNMAVFCSYYYYYCKCHMALLRLRRVHVDFIWEGYEYVCVHRNLMGKNFGWNNLLSRTLR